MRISITQALQNYFSKSYLDQALFVHKFSAWKTGGEYDSFLFGKDSAYVRPEVDGRQYMLRHVHLVPLADGTQLDSWNRVWVKRGRKTSDRALIYVDDDNGGYLLITILDEPDAHEIARMKTARDREIMEGFAHVAAAFMEDGTVLG
jgi:Toxin YafO, type II toxin-antitoxin system